MEKFCDLTVKVSSLDVRLADRSDLFRILPFLERHLPFSCEVRDIQLFKQIEIKS